MKKFVLVGVLLAIFVSATWAGILNFVPTTANFVIQFRNNTTNYTELKKVKIFSFLLNDLGIENLIQSSVSQSAVSMNIKSSQVWSMLENDFVVFGEGVSKEVNAEIVLKGDSKVALGLLSAFIGGKTSAVKVGNLQMKTFSTNGFTLYVMGYEGYVLASNSSDLIQKSVEAYKGKIAAFSFKGKVPNNAWFGFYTSAGTISQDSTFDIIPLDGYGYGTVENGTLSINGVARFTYKEEELKEKMISFKPSAIALEDTPASGDLWIAGDIADPVKFYDLLKEYPKEFGLKKDELNSSQGEELASSFNGKMFVNGSISSDEGNYTVSVYLSKDVSKYIPTFSKNASATFTWNGHTVLRDDSKEGTRVVHTYTIFYPDKVVITDMAPAESVKFTDAKKKAKEMGNYSSFKNTVWKDSFLLGYFDLGNLVKSAFQYPITSGIIVQLKFDKNADVVWQLIMK